METHLENAMKDDKEYNEMVELLSGAAEVWNSLKSADIDVEFNEFVSNRDFSIRPHVRFPFDRQNALDEESERLQRWNPTELKFKGSYEGPTLVNTLRLGMHKSPVEIPEETYEEDVMLKARKPELELKKEAFIHLVWRKRNREVQANFKTLLENFEPWKGDYANQTKEYDRITSKFNWDINSVDSKTEDGLFERTLKLWYIDVKLAKLLMGSLINKGQTKFEDIAGALTEKKIKDDISTFVATEFDGYTNFLIRSYTKYADALEYKKGFFGTIKAIGKTILRPLAELGEDSAEYLIAKTTHENLTSCIIDNKDKWDVRTITKPLSTPQKLNEIFKKQIVMTDEGTFPGRLRKLVGFIIKSKIKPDTILKDHFERGGERSIKSLRDFFRLKDEGVKLVIKLARQEYNLTDHGKTVLTRLMKDVLEDLWDCVVEQYFMPYEEFGKKYVPV
jgi:hypothetical protein